MTLPARFIALLCLLPIGTALINTTFFGSESLAAYFGYSLFAPVLTLTLLLRKFKSEIPVPLDIRFFIVVALLAFLHGVFTRATNLTHFYWLVSGLFLFTLNHFRGHLMAAGRSSPQYNAIVSFVSSGIILIALFESVVVLLQWLNVIESKNTSFACTGTWVNPNVTAMFLGLSLFSQKELFGKRIRKSLFITQVLVILLAILLLRSRTAYIITVIFLLEAFINHFLKSKAAAIRISIITLLLLVFALGLKIDSTNSRVQIWKNSFELILAKPVTGVGFGQFEKEYNAFVVQNQLPSSDHAFTAYNDFLEFTVEGGIVIGVLWVCFLISLIRRVIKSSDQLSLVISFLIIQLTNFGFQAIPVFALFLFYTGFVLRHDKEVQNDKERPHFQTQFKLITTLAAIAGLVILIKICSIATAFRFSNVMRDEVNLRKAFEAQQSVSSTLDFSSIYHESYGDLFMKAGYYRQAKMQYRKALETTSRPNVLGKCGWCYGLLGDYDSASYYFKFIEDLLPYKYAPRLAMLKLYEQKRDTLSAKRKAIEIIAMPVKVPSEEVDSIKMEAAKWLHEVPRQ